MEFFKKLFDSDFMPHGHCYFWKPEIVWTNAISDSIIAIAYLTIPLSLTYIVRTRKDFRYYWLLVLFAFFILGCGATHVMDVINIWTPLYRLDSMLRVITAMASIGTALVLVKFTPKILLIPTAENYKRLNDDLTKQINELKEKDQTIQLLTDLKNSEEKYKLVIDSIKDYAIFMLDVHGNIATWSDASAKIFGYDADEIINKNFNIFFDRQSLGQVSSDALLTQVSHIGSYEEFGYRKAKNGSEIWVHATLASIYSSDKVCIGFSCIFQDLTAVKAAQEKQENTAAQLLTIMDTMPIVVWTAEPDGNLDFYNKAWFEYTQFDSEQSMNWGWKPVLHPDDLQPTIDVWTESFQTGKPYQVEYRWKRGSDKMYRWHLGRALPIKNESGEIVKWIGTGTDIHDQKTIAEENTRKNKELTKINMDLDNFIYTASHDLKAPVSNIEGLLSALNELIYNKSAHVEQQIIEMIQLSINKFKITIQDLTEISKLQKLTETVEEEINFIKVIEEVKFDINVQIVSTKTTINTDIKVEYIRFSKKNLRSILYNLLSNSIKYKQENIDPVIKVCTYQENDYIILEVTDNGLGFDSINQNKLFHMFKRLHNHVEGSGVGLYIVKRIIDNIGGKIETRSSINQGATFKLFFPVVNN